MIAPYICNIVAFNKLLLFFMRSFIIGLMLTISSLNSFLAQTSITISDADSNLPVPFALIYFTDLKVGYSADSNGIAQLPVLLRGSADISISCIGYATQLLSANLDTLRHVALIPTHNHMDEVVVSADMTRLGSENVANIDILKLHASTSAGYITLADALTQLPGVQQVSTGNGIGKPSIRGLSGSRVVVYAQNTRIENQQWGDEHGLGLDDTGIESVEVIKGPSSLLYGADAMGGVLFFVDEAFAKKDMLQGSVTSKYFTNSNGTRTSGSVKWSNGKWHINSSGAYNSHTDYTDGNGVEVRNSRFKTNVARVALGYQNNKWSTALRYTLLNESYGLTELDEREEVKTNAREPLEPYQNLRTQIISWENTLYLNKSKVKVNLGWVSNHRQEFESHHHEEDSLASEHEAEELAAIDLQLQTITYNARWQRQILAQKLSLIVGSQGMLQSNRNNGEEVLIPNADQIDAGLFSLLNFHYAKNSNLQFGLRIDTRKLNPIENESPEAEGYKAALNKTFQGLNGSLGAMHSVGTDVVLRLNTSTAFRAPNTFELLSNGEHHGTQRFEIGDPHLKSERGIQLDATFEVRQEHFEFWINPFYNRIQNFIYLSPTNEVIDELPVYNYLQRDASLAGTELGIHIHPHPWDWLHIDLNYAGVSGELTDGKNLPLIPANRIMSTVRGELTSNGFVQKWRFALQYSYTFRQTSPARFETSTNAYQLFNASVGADLKWFKQTISLDLGIRNATGENYFDHLSRYKYQGIFNQGRNFYLSLRVPFEFKMKEKSQ